MTKKSQKKVLIVMCLLALVSGIVGMQMKFTPIDGAKLSPDTIIPTPVVNISNSLITMWACCLLILVFTFFARRNAGIIPTKTQLIAESIIEFFLDKIQMATGDYKEAKKFLAPVVTVFLLILFSNQFGLIPIFGAITSPDGPIFRTPTADYSLTIALALTLVGIGHLTAFARAPFSHIFNFIKINQLFKIKKLSDIPMVLLEIFLGILDIIGELAKILSMSSRLFGNLVAGDLMIAIISGLAFFSAFWMPIPFIFLSAFSGVIQAVVFAMLGLQFMIGTINAVPKPKSSSHNHN